MTTIENLLSNTNFKHSRHVSKISKLIAAKAGYSEDEVQIIEQAGLLHDVGKTAISSNILNKPDALTPEEYELIKKHTDIGYQKIMETIKILTVAASVAKEHHERLDGSGYHKLSGENINPYAKLIMVADVFDALVSRRSYKKAWDTENAIKYLTEHENHFDPDIVRCLISIIDELMLLYKTNLTQNIASNNAYFQIN